MMTSEPQADMFQLPRRRERISARLDGEPITVAEPDAPSIDPERRKNLLDAVVSRRNENTEVKLIWNRHAGREEPQLVRWADVASPPPSDAWRRYFSVDFGAEEPQVQAIETPPATAADALFGPGPRHPGDW